MNSDNVTYNGDLSAPFDPNLIDGFSLRSVVTGKLERCEHWGWNEEGENEHPYFDFGGIGYHAAFEVYTNHVQIFMPLPLYLGFEYNSPWTVKWIGDHENPPAGYGLFPERLDVEKKYPRPSTMEEMMLHLIDYYAACRTMIAEIEVSSEKNNNRLILEAELRAHEKPSANNEDLLPF